MIGLVCVERTSPKLQYDIESMSLLFYDEILRGVEATIRDPDWSLLITYLEEDSEPDLPRLLSLSGKVDGLLIGEGIVPPQFVARLAERLPVVVIAGNPRERAADVVTADNRSGSIALVTHLIDRARPAAVPLRRRPGEPRPTPSSGAAGSPRCCAAHPDCELVGCSHGQFSVGSGEEAGQQLLAERRTARRGRLRQRPDGDRRAAVASPRQASRVPDQVAVVGFDDIFPGSLCDPPLTTVHQPMRLLGERACTRLLDRIAKPDLRPRVESLPTELVLGRAAAARQAP